MHPASGSEIQASVDFQVSETAAEWTTKNFFLILKNNKDDSVESESTAEEDEAPPSGGRAGEDSADEPEEARIHVEASETVPTNRED